MRLESPWWLLALPVLFASGLLFAAPPADKKDPDKPAIAFTEIKGSIDDEKLQKFAPANGVITNTKDFETLWQGWKLGENVPKINFEKNLILVATTRGGRLNMKPRLDDKGDLKAVAIATRDLRPGFRYQIVLFPREGVKTVNGKELK